MVQKFPESVPRLRHNTRKNISGEKQLNCALICIIVHINEAPAYEYSYFLFCCLIKKGEGGLIMTAPAVERNRSMADEWITTFETRFLDKRGGGHRLVSAHSIQQGTNTLPSAHSRVHTPLMEQNQQNRKELLKHCRRAAPHNEDGKCITNGVFIQTLNNNWTSCGCRMFVYRIAVITKALFWNIVNFLCRQHPQSDGMEKLIAFKTEQY